MTSHEADQQVTDGALVSANDMSAALTRAVFLFDDGARQTFNSNGQTTYIDGGGPTRGEWSIVGDGRFASFWPPSYRATYTLRWIVDSGTVTGLEFMNESGDERFRGRYSTGAGTS